MDREPGGERPRPTGSRRDRRAVAHSGWGHNLVEQIEWGNGRDDHGHPLKNLKQLREARALVDQIEDANATP
jgi:hypothetical protein